MGQEALSVQRPEVLSGWTLGGVEEQGLVDQTWNGEGGRRSRRDWAAVPPAGLLLWMV